MQFVLVLDVTVVNVALPRMQQDLGISQPGLAWVVNAYVVMAGGFLLLGGRLADLFGRRRLFMVGTAVFALASAVCGAAVSSEMLISGRFVQGLGEAMAAPAALGLIALIFQDTAERVKAIGIWGGISGIAGVTGVVISGVLTDLASWRWIFYLNIPIALFALFVLPRLVSESRMVRDSKKLDVPGAVTATGGLLAIVYGLLQAAEHPWGSSGVVWPILGGLGLLVIMAIIELNTKDPIIPLHFFRNRTRVTANIVGLLFLAAFISYFFITTLVLQQVLDYPPLRGGLAYVPFGIAMGVGMGIGTGLMPKLGVKPVLTIGFLGTCAGLLLASAVDADSRYLTGILPGMLVFGTFTGLVVPGIANASLHDVTGQDASLASGVQQAVQQVGSAIGLAFLVTLALRHAADSVERGTVADVAAADGHSLAYQIGALIVLVCGVLVLLLFQKVTAEPRNALAEVETDSPAGVAAQRA